MLDSYEPLVRVQCSFIFQIIHRSSEQIPNEVTDHYLQRVGFECEDVRLYVSL